MQFLLICIKNSEKKQKENISFKKTNYTSNIYFHCDQGTSKLLTVKKNSDINFSTYNTFTRIKTFVKLN